MSPSLQSGCSFLSLWIVLALAARRATSVASLAVPCMTPPPWPPGVQDKNSFGRSNIFPNQSIMTTSRSVQAGLDIWRHFQMIKNPARVRLNRRQHYPCETDASDSGTENVGNDGGVGIGCREVREEVRGVPVGNAWHYNSFNVIHDILPRLWLFRSLRRYQRSNITGRHSWQYSPATISLYQNVRPSNTLKVIASIWRTTRIHFTHHAAE